MFVVDVTVDASTAWPAAAGLGVKIEYDFDRARPAGGLPFGPHTWMLLLGWASDDMPRRYGASAAERAQQIHARLEVGEHV